MLTAFDPSMRVAQDGGGERVVVVAVAVAHVAAEQNRRVIQYRALAFGRRRQQGMAKPD